MELAQCPSRETLQAFCLGQLNDPPFQDVATHLDRCSACQTTLDSVAHAPDTIAIELRRCGANNQIVDDPECDHAIRRFLTVGREFSDAADPGGSVADNSSSEVTSQRLTL